MRSEGIAAALSVLVVTFTGCGGGEKATSGASTSTGAGGAAPASCESRPTNRSAVQIAMGYEEGYALLSDGTVWCWGSFPSARCPQGDRPPRDGSPRQLALKGCATTIALGSSLGAASVSGLGAPVLLGDGAPVPPPGESPTWIDVKGELAVWGGPEGITWWGDDTWMPDPPLEPQPFPFEADRVYLSGAHHCFTRDGELFCFGLNGEGNLGDGTVNPDPYAYRTEPVKVLIPVDVVTMSMGPRRNYAVDEEGSLWTWGKAPAGSTEPKGPAPERYIAVPELCGIVSSSAACGWTCDGEVYCWGGNQGQLLGDDDRDYSVPQRIRDLEPAAELSMRGSSPLCSRKLTDGSVWCRGYNGRGALPPEDGAATEVVFRDD